MRTIGPVALLCATLWAVDADAQLRAAAALPTPRSDHGAVVLADGRVLFAGGIGQTLAVSSSTVLYDPVADAWSAGAPLAAPRIDFPLARLASGRVLAVSGYAPTVGIDEPSAGVRDVAVSTPGVPPDRCRRRGASMPRPRSTTGVCW